MSGALAVTRPNHRMRREIVKDERVLGCCRRPVLGPGHYASALSLG